MRDAQTSLMLHFDGAYQLAADDEPSRFLFEAGGKLVLTDDDDNKTEVGVFSAMTVDVQAAIVERESVFDIFDSDSTSIGYFDALYDHDSCDFKPEVVNVAYGDDYLWNPNLLILDRLAVYPEHRGHGIGLLALRALIHRLRVGVGLIAMKPYPLQFEARLLDESDLNKGKRLGLDGFKLSQQKATAKLKKYYSRLGFKAVPRTEYMVRSVELPLPSVTSLRPSFR